MNYKIFSKLILKEIGNQIKVKWKIFLIKIMVLVKCYLLDREKIKMN